MDQDRPLLVDTGRGLSVFWRGRWLYSRRDPAAAPERVSATTEVAADTLYLVFSPVLCYGIQSFLARLPASSAILCVEADRELAVVATEALHGMPETHITIADPAGAARRMMELEGQVHGRRFRRIVELRLTGGRDLNTEAYDATMRSLELDLSVRFRNRMTLVRMGRLWSRNIVANLTDMDWTRTVPLPRTHLEVVVCGAGPSLDLVLPALRSGRDGLYVLAVDTAAGALVRAGIVPDAVVCLEAQVYNVADFLPLAGSQVHLIADLTAHPSTFRAVRGPVSLVLSAFAGSGFLDRLRNSGLPLTRVPPLGSVGVLALHLAGMIGPAIRIAGLDFSFGQGVTHCTGSPTDMMDRCSETRTGKRQRAWNSAFRDGVVAAGRSVETGRGTMDLRTDPALSMYAKLAADELSRAIARGIRVLDARNGCGLPLPAGERLTAPEMVPVDASGTVTTGCMAGGMAGAGVSDAIGTGTTASSAGAGGPAGAGEGAVTSAGASDGTAGDGNAADDVSTGSSLKTMAARFLAHELSIIDTVRQSLRETCGPDTLRSRLLEADLLYLHFPDPERVTELADDALRRVAVEADWWRARLTPPG